MCVGLFVRSVIHIHEVIRLPIWKMSSEPCALYLFNVCVLFIFERDEEWEREKGNLK